MYGGLVVYVLHGFTMIMMSLVGINGKYVQCGMDLYDQKRHLKNRNFWYGDIFLI